MSTVAIPQSGLRQVDLFTLSRDIVDKLRMMNYELSFCSTTYVFINTIASLSSQYMASHAEPIFSHSGYAPITYIFFCVQGKVDEVYPYFVALCNWLFEVAKVDLNKMGLQPLSEFGDMTQVPLSIINACKNLGLVEDEKILSVAKIRAANPETLAVIVDFLVTYALNANDFELAEAAYTAAAAAHEAHVDTGAVMGEEMEETIENSTQGNKARGVAKNTNYTSEANAAARTNPERAAIASDTTHEQWKLHYEALLPRLAFANTTALREWRNHFQQTSMCKQAVSADLPETTSMLTRLSKDLKQKVDKVRMKENQLNTQLNNESTGIAKSIRDNKAKLLALEADYSRINDELAHMTDELAEESQRLTRIKTAIDAKNAAMTDTTPLATLQETISQLKKENAQMEVKLGILNYMYLQGQQAQQTQKQRMEAANRISSAAKNRASMNLTLTRKKEVKF